MSSALERTVTDSPDQLSRGDRGTRQSRRWLSSEIPLGALLETPYGALPEEAAAEGLRVRTHDVLPAGAALPFMPWTVTRKEQVWTPRLAHLVEQANASQWNASLDVPWPSAQGLADHLEAAVCDLFTWLLQQELVAHYVPSVWLPQIHPAFLEVKLFLSGKVMDEARHTEACLKRLWLNGVGPTPTPPDTDAALAPLCLLEDYEQASLLVDILGEGQILDVFKIVYDLAPDEATRRIVLLSRRTRHGTSPTASHGSNTGSRHQPIPRPSDARSSTGSPPGSRSPTSSSRCRASSKRRSACSAAGSASTAGSAPAGSRSRHTSSAAPGSRQPACRLAPSGSCEVCSSRRSRGRYPTSPGDDPRGRGGAACAAAHASRHRVVDGGGRIRTCEG